MAKLMTTTPTSRATGSRRLVHASQPFLVAVVLLLAPVVISRAVDLQVLKGHVPAAATQAPPVGRLGESERLHLAIGLPLRNQAELTQLLKDLSNPASPRFRQYLTPAEFTGKFGPAAEDYQALVEFAKSRGLTVTATHPNRVVLSVEGAVSDIEKAFHVTMRTYQHPTEARTFYATDTEPSLDLAVPVLHISGLDNYSLPHPNLKAKASNNVAKATPNAGSGPSGAYAGGDFRAAYVPGVTLTGTGQSVGLLQFDGYYASDIASYRTQFGVPNIPLVNVAVDGGVTTPGSGNSEVCLDIEMVSSMAPGLSTIYVYEAPNPSPWVDLLSRMANDNLAKQLSCSWGGGSPDPSSEAVFQQMAAQGQSFFNATGDSDAFTGSVPFPSDSPNITEVGATTLTTNGAGGSYTSETVWNWGGGTGSSGGSSTYYSIPTWQSGVSMATNQGSTTMRNAPDVAMVGDNVYVAYNNGGSGTFGGTSCAAPLWAAFTALVNQQAAANGQPAVGFLNPAIYAIGTGTSYGSNFHDCTTGNNYSGSSPSKFAAVAGYDLCTGWGSPAGSALITSLAGPADSLQLAGTDLTGIGPVGGPFAPASTSYILTNRGASPLAWTASTSQTWITVSPTGGNLDAGATVTVTVSLNAANVSPTTGTYSGTVSFLDTTSGVSQSRPVNVNVTGPPSLTVSPTGSFTATGGAGGPFTPSSVTYTLTNTGAPSMNWTATNTSTWLSLSSNGGTLAAGASTTITASINSSANSMATGSYTDSVNFVNVTNGNGNSTTPVSLNILQGSLVAVPPQSTTYQGNVRGYWFTAPVAFTIEGLQVPTDAGTGNQSIAVMRMTASPPAYPGSTNSFTTLFLTQNNPTAGMIPVTLYVAKGDIIGILGYRGTTNSYGASPYSSQILGVPVSLARLGMQYALTTSSPQNVWADPSTASLGRVDMYVTANTTQPVITSATSAGATQGVPFSYQIVATNNPSSYAATGLPANLTVNTSTGLISGTATTVGTYTVVLSAANSAATGTANLTLTVNAPLNLLPASLPAGSANSLYNQTLQVGGGTSPYTLTVGGFNGGTTGLTSGAVTANSTAGTLTIKGTPSGQGTVSFSVAVSDASGATLTVPYSFAVNPPLVLSPGSLPSGAVNAAYSQTISVSGGSVPYTTLSVSNFNAGGTGLTAGMISTSISAGTVTIQGTPNAPGTASFSVTVNDSSGSTLTTSYSITVNLPATPPVLQPLPAFIMGTANTVQWNAVPGAISYDVQVSGAPSFASLISTQNVTTNAATFAGLSDGGLYYYRARSDFVTPASTQSWTQTSQADFGVDVMTGVSSTAAGDVTLTNGTGGAVTGRIQNPSFESGLTGWTSQASTYMGVENNSTYYPPVPSAGSSYAVLYTYFGPTRTVGALAQLSQSVDFTSLSSLTFDALLRGSPLTWANGVVAQVLIDNQVVWSQTSAGGYATQSVNVSGYTGVHTLALRETVTSAAGSSDSQWFCIDNLQTYGVGGYASSGKLVSPAITPAAPFLGWSTLSYNVTIPTGASLTVDVLDASGNLLAANVASGVDLSTLPAVAAVSAIKLRANLATNSTAITPALHDWTVAWRTSTAYSYSSAWSNVVSATQDATAPVLVITSPATGSYTTFATATITGTATDVTSGVASVTVNGVTATTSDGFAHWSATVPLNSGGNTLTATATDKAQAGGNIATATVTIARQADTEGKGVPDWWKAAHGLTGAAANAMADPSGRGLTNLLAYAFNIDPASGNPGTPISTQQVNANDGQVYLTISYPRLIGALQLSYIVEISNDLANWSSPSAQITELSAVPNPDGVTETVTDRVSPSISGGGPPFARVRVSSP